MEEEGRRARARQGRGDLLADHAGLAHAGDDDLAGTREHRGDRALEGGGGPGLDEALTEARDGLRLEPQHEGAAGRGRQCSSWSWVRVIGRRRGAGRVTEGAGRKSPL